MEINSLSSARMLDPMITVTKSGVRFNTAAARLLNSESGDLKVAFFIDPPQRHLIIDLRYGLSVKHVSKKAYKTGYSSCFAMIARKLLSCFQEAEKDDKAMFKYLIMEFSDGKWPLELIKEKP